MSEIKRFTAEEARAAMPSKKRISGTEMLLNHAYRRIKGAATANENYVYVKTEIFYSGAIVDVLNILKEDGYTVDYDYGTERITVRW